MSIFLLLPLCYLLSLPVAENPYGAWNSLLKWGSFISFLFVLYWIKQDRRIGQWFPVVFQFTGTAIAIFSLLVYFSWIPFRGGIIAERLAGVFKYPNTFGMVMAAFLLFSLLMLLKDEKKKRSLVVYSLPIVTFFVCFILSYSRGMLLVFPIVWLLALAMLPFRKQLALLWLTIISTGVSFPVYLLMTNSAPFWGTAGWLIGSLLIAGIVYWNLGERFLSFIPDLSRLLLPFLVLVAALLGALDIKYEGLLYRSLPEELQDRISSISLSKGTAKERLILMEDSVEMAKDAPVLGHGGEGFRVLYKNYQQLPYQSNKVHNGYMEWLVDTGIIGLILLVIVIAFLYFQLIKRYKAEGNNIQVLAVTITSLAMLLHSALDFNFSFGSVWLLFFWLVAMGLPEITPTAEKIGKMKKWMGVLCYSLFALLILFSSIQSYRFMKADSWFQEHAKAATVEEKEMFLKKVVAWHPYHTLYVTALAEVYAYKAGDNTAYLEKLEETLQQLEELELENPDTMLKIGDIYSSAANLDKALVYYQMGLEMDRYSAGLYERVIRLEVIQAMEGKDDNKERSLNYALSIYKQNKNVLDDFLSLPMEDHDAFNSRKYKVNDGTNYFAAVAHFHLGEYKESLKLLEPLPSGKTSSYTERCIALTVLAMEESGDAASAADVVEEHRGDYPSLTETMEELRIKGY
ncbi:O-antigen ligase family protein [Bacillus tianshenii]|uniref:O-antigen ligase family protein n=1 Tax=Sutcliffiella tianshenii TaxID=1463404 RepID=UPI001CD562DD|nr:O-antigen ligase family protein [Bacillus tianshenii]MCA1320479.1 O-antigen ligase family protein [Bacillus tianshenii]